MDEELLDRNVRAAVYRLFVDRGRAPVAAELSQEIGENPARVEASLQRLHDNHILVLAPGTPYIWMANPFSALPTPYTVTTGGKTFWANCIWDGLGIVAMLGAEGSVDSFCPDCAGPLRVEVRDGDLVTSDHVIHYTVPARKWWDDIGFN